MTTAADLCQAGGTLVVLDFPVGARFGLDLASWATGERFLGVKMLPPGVHLIHVSAASSEGFGQPTSIFLTFRPGEVRTVRWDAGTEALGPVTEEEGARYAAAARSFALDAQLGPYPLEKYHTWKGLVSHLDATTLDRLNPLSKRISSTTQPTEPTAEQPAGSGIYYTTLDLRVDPMGLTPAEVTKRGMDKSYLLDGGAREDDCFIRGLCRVFGTWYTNSIALDASAVKSPSGERWSECSEQFARGTSTAPRVLRAGGKRSL